MLLKYEDVLMTLKNNGFSDIKFSLRDYDEDFEGIAIIFKDISLNKDSMNSTDTLIQLIVRYKDDYPQALSVAERLIYLLEIEGLYNIDLGDYGIIYMNLVNVIDLRSENGYEMFSFTIDCKIKF